MKTFIGKAIMSGAVMATAGYVVNKSKIITVSDEQSERLSRVVNAINYAHIPALVAEANGFCTKRSAKQYHAVLNTATVILGSLILSNEFHKFDEFMERRKENLVADGINIDELFEKHTYQPEDFGEWLARTYGQAETETK